MESTRSTIEVGHEAPDFRLKGPGGAFVTLSEYRGQKHVVLVFYPLAFSPVCAHQLPTLQRDLRRLEDLDAVVLGPRLPFGARTRVKAWGAITLMDRGMVDDKLICSERPPDASQRRRQEITRQADVLVGRKGARLLSVVSGGTIPDRGLYGVFLLGAGPGAARVGELDEEMVFESRVGETFLLGASTWRIEEITHDRVLVSPAPGEPGKMPFWHGDRPGRPLEFGLHVGKLSRELARAPKRAYRHGAAAGAHLHPTGCRRLHAGRVPALPAGDPR